MVEAGSAAGRLVVFEGIDGCGKSTQAEALVRWLAERRPERVVRRLREPGGTAFGEGVRDLLLHTGEMGPMAEMLMYMAARAELYDIEVLPALERGEVVVLDRSQYSTAAYQGAGLGLDEEFIFELARAVTGTRAPDRVVLLDLSVDAAAERLSGARADRIEARGPEYFARVRSAYRRYARDEPERFAVVAAAGAPEAVAALVQEALADVL